MSGNTETIMDLAVGLGINSADLTKGLKNAEGEAIKSVDKTTQKIADTQKSILSRLTEGTSNISQMVAGGLQLAQGHYDQLGSVLRGLPGIIGVVTGAAGDMFGKAIDSTIEYTEAMRKASVVTGASVEFVSQFTEAADDQFVSQETVVTSLTRFSKALGGAIDMEGGMVDGGKGVAQTLKDMNITFDASASSGSQLQQALPQLADAFQELGNGPKAAALAIQLFGRSGTEMMPVLVQGRAALESAMKAADAMGLSIGTKDVIAVTRLKMAQDQLSDSVTALGRKLSLSFIPIIADVVTWVNHYVETTKKFDEAIGPEKSAIYLAYWKEQFVAVTPAISNARTAMYGAAQAAGDLMPKLDSAASAALGLAKATNPLIASLSFSGLVKYNEGLQREAFELWRSESATKGLAASQVALSQNIDLVKNSMTGSLDLMGKQALAIAAYELATGKLTVTQFETQRAASALTDSYLKGFINLNELTMFSYQLANGILSTKDAFYLATGSGDAYSKQLGAVEAAARNARGEVDRTSTSLLQVPTGVTTTFDFIVPPSSGSDVVKDITDQIHRNLGMNLPGVSESASEIVNRLTNEIHNNTGMTRAADDLMSKLSLGVESGGESVAASFSQTLRDSITSTKPLAFSLGSSIGLAIMASMISAMKSQASSTPVSYMGTQAYFQSRDSGGPVSAGSVYNIGVPEVFIPSSGGNIIPLGGASGLGNTSVTVSVGNVSISNGDDKDSFLRSVAEAAEQGLRQALGQSTRYPLGATRGAQ